MLEQTLFNGLILVTAGVGGWLMKMLWDSVLDLKSDVKMLDTKIHENYVRRDDFKDALKDLKHDFGMAIHKLEQTVAQLIKKLDKE